MYDHDAIEEAEYADMAYDDMREEFEDRIAELTTWKPIATLPENGEPGDVVVVMDDKRCCDCAEWRKGDWCHSGLPGLWVFREGHTYTHWLPLPPVGESDG